MSKPSVILMGSKPGSVVALATMLERNWDVRAVVVSRSRTHPWVEGPTLEEFALEKGLPVYTQKELPREQADFVISYMFRYLVKSDVIALAKRAAVNFHAGPLPEYGGWAFYNVAILEDAAEYGCTCHYMDDNFDTGPLFKVRRFPIDASQETALSLEAKAQQEMVRLFIDFVTIAESGEELPYEVQNPEKMRYMTHEEFLPLKRIDTDANLTGEAIQKTARAFWYPPYESAYIDLNGVHVEVVPEIVKDQLAQMYHQNDYSTLKQTAEEYWENKR